MSSKISVDFFPTVSAFVLRALERLKLNKHSFCFRMTSTLRVSFLHYFRNQQYFCEYFCLKMMV